VATVEDIIAFKARFSEFAKLSDPPIAAVLNTADVYLDDVMWSPRDFPLARMLWAAHLLTLQQTVAANSTIDGTGMSDLFVRSIRFGDRTVTFEQRQSFMSAQAGMEPGEILLSSTTYGQLFLQLRSRNIIPVTIV
jgi:hypothetical protein